MNADEDSSFWRLVARWPNWVRVLIAWGAVAATIPAMILALDAVASRLGFSACGNRLPQEQPWICSSAGRLTLLATSLVIGWSLLRPWARFLARLSSTPSSASDQSHERDTSSEASKLRQSTVRLPFRQVYLSGELHVVQRGLQRTLTIADAQLTIAGDGARHFDDWTQGRSAEVVCQLVPGSPDLRLLMAARLAGDERVYAIGVGAQSAAVVMALLCMAWFGILSPRPSVAWTILCGLLMLVSLSYLILARRAFRSLAQMRRPPPLE